MLGWKSNAHSRVHVFTKTTHLTQHLTMSSTPITSRRQQSRGQVAIQSPANVNGKWLRKEDTGSGESDSDSASGYSTPVGKLVSCVSPSQVPSKFSFPPKWSSIAESSVSKNGSSKLNMVEHPNEECNFMLRCDVTCPKRSLSGNLCDCSLRWKKAANQAFECATSGADRRVTYERAERTAGRDPDPKICARLERDASLYPNCDMTIWLRTCDVESVVPITGQVFGVIPLWIRGTLLHNGPGRLKFGEEEFAHLFDGSALLQRYAIYDGTATYQSRFLKTDTFLKNSAAQRIVVSEYGTRACFDPCQSIFNRVAAIFTPGEAVSDNAMISVCPFGDEFYAFTESTIVTRFDPITLHTIDRVNLAQYLGIINHSAHPVIFPDSAISLGMSLGTCGPLYTLIHFPVTNPRPNDISPPTKNIQRQTTQPNSGTSDTDDLNCSHAFDGGRIVARVPARWPLHPSYMHTFGLTETFFVLIEQPMSVSVAKVLHNHLDGGSTGTAMRWFPEYPTLIHLVERASGRHCYTFCTATLFFLHVINAFERDDVVVIDICCYENPEMINCMYIEALKTGQRNPDYARMFRGRPLRFEMPLQGDAAKAAYSAASQAVNNRSSATACQDPTFIRPNQLSDLGCETPRIPQDLIGKAYRYFYAISSDVDLDNPGTLIKVDTIRKRSWRWAEDGVYPSEPIYVPRPSSQAEDDGVVLSALTWCFEERRTALLILDAPTWTEVGRVEFNTPGCVPKSLHGWFASNVL